MNRNEMFRIMRNSFIGVLLLFFLLGCNEEDDSLNIDCSEIACTEIFISHHVTVKDPSGVAIPLDSISVTDVDTGEDITRSLTDEEFEEARRTGTYPLYDDLTDANEPGISRHIVFEGFIASEKVISAEYQVGRDCCHSAVGKGNLNLILE